MQVWAFIFKARDHRQSTYNGPTGELLKVFQDRGVVIIVVSAEDIGEIASGDNFVTMLRNKYEEVRLDLPK